MFVRNLPFNMTAVQCDFVMRAFTNQFRMRVNSDDQIEMFREFGHSERVYVLTDRHTIEYSDGTPIGHDVPAHIHYNLPPTEWTQENTSEEDQSDKG